MNTLEKQLDDGCLDFDFDKVKEILKKDNIDNLIVDHTCEEKRCADCNHYGKLSLDCGRCDDDYSMYEPHESEDKE